MNAALAQRQAALTRANEIRTGKARLKRALNALPTRQAATQIAQLLETRDPIANRCTVRELTRACRGIGDLKTSRLVHLAAISTMDKRIHELTDRQRNMLAFALRSGRWNR
jgi:cytolysin (calcineurin-like family phosphatase)